MFDWARVWLIARRELVTRFRQRSYRWTLVVQVLVAAIAAVAPVGLAWFTDGDSGNASVVIVDEADAGVAERIVPYLQAEGDILPAIEVRTDASSADEAREMVDDGDVGYALIVTGEAASDAGLAYELVTDSGSTSSIEAQRIMAGVMSVSVEMEAEARGVSPEEARQLLAMPEIGVQTVEGEEGESDPLLGFQSAEYAVAYVGVMLIYIAIILYGTWIAQGVAEEKGSRIMEIMVNAATPRDLLAGKVLGIMLAGLAQLVPMLIVGGTLFSQQKRIADALDVSLPSTMDIDFASLSVTAIGAFLVYFLLGFILYGGLYAGVGSMVSRQEEVNQAVSPMMTLVIISFFGAFVALNVPDSTFAKVLMYIPITSPFVAVPRIVVGDPGWTEIAISVGLLAVAAIGAMWLAGRLYRVGVLMYGQRPSWKSLFKMGGMQSVAR